MDRGCGNDDDDTDEAVASAERHKRAARAAARAFLVIVSVGAGHVRSEFKSGFDGRGEAARFEVKAASRALDL